MSEEINYRNGDIRKFFVTKKKETKTKIIFHTRVNGEIRNVTDNKDVDKMPHDTLVKALRCALPFGLMLLKLVPKDVKMDAGYINRKQIINDANFIDYELVGFELKDDDEELKCELVVRKRIMFDKTIDMKTGFVALVHKTEFDLSGNLKDALDDIIEEVYQYHEGKTAGSEQAVLFDDDEQEEEDVNPFPDDDEVETEEDAF